MISENTVYRCKTKELAEKFMEVCKKHDILWSSGDRPSETDTRWSRYESDTCYRVDENTLTYANADFYLRYDCKIIDYTGKDIFEESETISIEEFNKLKPGDEVELKTEEELVAIFGEKNGDILTTILIVPSMRKYLGKTHKISSANYSDVTIGGYYFPIEAIKSKKPNIKLDLDARFAELRKMISEIGDLIDKL